jgi:hypothetical protein
MGWHSNCMSCGQLYFAFDRHSEKSLQVFTVGSDIRDPIWFWFYRLLFLLPLVIGAICRPPGAGRGFLLSFAVACGYVGLSIVALEFSLVARLKPAQSAFIGSVPVNLLSIKICRSTATLRRHVGGGSRFHMKITRAVIATAVSFVVACAIFAQMVRQVCRRGDFAPSQEPQ